MEFPNKHSKQYLGKLEMAGLATLVRDTHSIIVSFKSCENYFHTKNHMLPWKDIAETISPCETKIFTNCQSKQNCQILYGAGSLCKYCFKCIAKKIKINS